MESAQGKEAWAAWARKQSSTTLEFHIFASAEGRLEPGTRVRTNPPGKSATYVCTVQQHHEDGSMDVLLDREAVQLPAGHDVQILDGKDDSGHVKKSICIHDPESKTVADIKMELFSEDLDSGRVVQFILKKRTLDDAMTLIEWPLGDLHCKIRVAVTEWPRYDSQKESFGLNAYSESGGVRPVEQDAPGRYIAVNGSSVFEAADSPSSDSSVPSSPAKLYVSEVVWAVDEIMRVRGFVEDIGWITLVDLRTGFRWAERAPVPMTGDTVRVCATDEHVQIIADSGENGLRYTVEGSETLLSEDDVEVVGTAAKKAVCLQLNDDKDGSKSVSCYSMAGDSLCTLEFQERESVLELRHRISQSIKVPMERLMCALPDGRLLAHLDRSLVSTVFELA